MFTGNDSGEAAFCRVYSLEAQPGYLQGEQLLSKHISSARSNCWNVSWLQQDTIQYVSVSCKMRIHL